MTVSKLKIGAVLAAVTVGCSLVALAGDKPVTPPAVKADEKAAPPAKVDPSNPVPKPVDKPVAPAVATVNGQDISRVEFGEYLIRKYGAKEIELFVNQRVIQDAAAEMNIRIRADEMVAAFEADAKSAGVSREDFVKVVLPKYGKTEHEYWTEVLTPRLILEKLGEGVTVTDDELKRAFETKYGEQRQVQLILWDKRQDRKAVEGEYSRACGAPIMFDAVARSQSSHGLAASKGVINPVGRHSAANGDQKLYDAIFKLNQEQVSELLETEQGWVAVKLVAIIPPRTDKKFEDEKAVLKVDVTREKVQNAIPKLYEKLKENAKTVFHLKPEPKVDSVQLPAKK